MRCCRACSWIRRRAERTGHHWASETNRQESGNHENDCRRRWGGRDGRAAEGRGGLGGSLCWLKTGGTGDDRTDGKIADETIKLLEANRNRPFFIACGFFRHHVPCAASENYFDLYSLDRIALPKEAPEHLAKIPQAALTVRPPNYGLSDEKLKIFTRAHHASTSLMDTQLGRVLAALDRLKLADNTVVAFISDHGWCLGEHGQWQKRLLFEESARVPMVIYAPGARGGGKVCTRPVELVDLQPTLAELCGLPAPGGAEGRSLAPLLADPAPAWDHPAFTQVAHGRIMGRSIRTQRWRYTEWDGGKGGAELYDHDADGHEYVNLAADPRHADTVAELKSALHKQFAFAPPLPAGRPRRKR